MLFGKRERFERTDVPQTPAAGMTLALAALAFVVVGSLIGLRVATVLSNRDLSLSDHSLSSVLSAQPAPEVPEGYHASSDIFTNVLLLTVDDVTTETATLAAAELLSIDETTGAATVVSFPLNTRVSNDAGTMMLQSLCAGSGPSSCVVPMSAVAGVKFSHVVISSTDVWAKFEELRGLGARELVLSSPEAFATLRTDMSNGELMDLVDRVGAVGSANITRIAAPAGETTLDDGTGVAVIDTQALRLSLGTLAAGSEEEGQAQGEEQASAEVQDGEQAEGEEAEGAE